MDARRKARQTLATHPAQEHLRPDLESGRDGIHGPDVPFNVDSPAAAPRPRLHPRTHGPSLTGTERRSQPCGAEPPREPQPKSTLRDVAADAEYGAGAWGTTTPSGLSTGQGSICPRHRPDAAHICPTRRRPSWKLEGPGLPHYFCGASTDRDGIAPFSGARCCKRCTLSGFAVELGRKYDKRPSSPGRWRHARSGRAS